MKRKILTIVLSLVAVFVCATALVACGDGDWDYGEYGDWFDDSSYEVVDGFRYYKGRDVNGNTIYAVYEDGAAKVNNALEIPSSYNGKPVTIFGGFKTEYKELGNIRSVVIPDSVTRIKEWAFEGCKSLTSVTIGNGLKSIGDSAFKGCKSLTSIVIPNGATSIGEESFCNCSSLASVEIPDSVTNIRNGVFSNTAYYNDDSNWENEVLYIGKHLIDSKSELSGAYTIKQGTITVAGGAFGYNSNLTSIEIPNSVKSIGDWAFTNCSSLTSIKIPDSLTRIGAGAFCGCSSMTSIEMPDSVKSIREFAFGGCDSLMIYCETTKKPNGWEDYWNIDNCPVVWGYKNQ